MKHNLLRLLPLIIFLVPFQYCTAQDTLFFNNHFEPVKTLALAEYLEIKLNDKVDTNRCTVLRQRINGDYLSVEKYSNYNDLIKNGRCRYWYDNKQMFSDIAYENGLQQGKETVYYPSGQIKRILVWDHDTIVSGTFFQEDGSPKTDLFKEDLERTELYTDALGPDGKPHFIMDNIPYPHDARDENIQGTVMLSFVVDQTGKVTNIKVEKGIYPSIDKAAIKWAQHLPRMYPATMNHFPVKAKYYIPVTFKLE